MPDLQAAPANLAPPASAASLSAARVGQLLAPHAALLTIRSVASTGSTNADLLAEAQADPAAMQPTALVAAIQTAGRGRAGRVWHSAPDATLTFSLAWRFERTVQQLAGLPLAIGVALADALAALGQPVALKWPNDILLDGAKLAGVLIETAGNKSTSRQPDGYGAGNLTWAVIGIGLNLALPAALAAHLQRSVASAAALHAMEREQLLATLLDHLTAALFAFEQDGFAAFQERWNRQHAFAGQAVNILDNGIVLQQGVACGVDAGGRLLLETSSGTVAVMAGDVSLRLQSDPPAAATVKDA